MDRNAKEHALRVLRSQLTPIEPYLDDSTVQEVMVNSPNEVWIERSGDMIRLNDIQLSDVNIRAAIKALAGANEKDVHPVLDCRMPGYRIAAALSPVGIKGNAICIRKHARSMRPLSSYTESGVFDLHAPWESHADNLLPRPMREEMAASPQAVEMMLRWIVHSKKNIMVVGSTGSGKTTFMNALLAEIPPDQRLVTIEDTAELQISLPNHVALETSEAHNVDIRKLVRLSLRFRPDRVVVGEVRGQEAYDLLDVMNTGHSGGACSLHADSAALALARLESMVRMHPDAQNLPLSALRTQIANTFNFIIYCSRHKGRRGPEAIAEVKGVRDGEYLIDTIFDRGGFDRSFLP